MSSPVPPPSALSAALTHLHAGAYFQTAAFAVLIYDHILTFSDEVERIWKQKMTGASILFLINRYITPIQFIIIIDAFQDPIWTRPTCNRFVIFEGASTVALISVCELILILRVYALYGRSTPIAVFLLILLAVQISLSSAGLHRGFAVHLPPGITGCILTATSPFFATVWTAPLVTDTFIFILTVWRTCQYIKRSGRSPTIDIFLRDGIIYFCVIFMANMLNTLLYFTAPPDIKPIGASFSQIITSVMISRLVLNLRSISQSADSRSARIQGGILREPHEENVLVTLTIGNLGEDLESFP